MLTIATKKELNNIEKIADVESRFRMLLNTGEKFESDVYTEIIKTIDSVEEREENIIRNQFGKTTLEKLSTGCKSVILAVYYAKKKVYVSIEECGENALRELFELSKKYDMHVYTRYKISIFENDVKCRIDGTLYTNGYDIYRKLGELNELN